MLNDEILQRVNRYLINETDFIKVKENLNEEQLRVFVSQAIDDCCHDQNMDLPLDQRGHLVRNLVSSVVSLGPLRVFMDDPSITEIMINGANQIYIQREGHIVLTDIKFNDNRHLLHTIQKILTMSGTNKRVDESSPYVDFSMTDGSRVNVIIQPCSNVGPVMTIRKFKDDIGTKEDLVNLAMIDEQMSTFLQMSMRAKLNVVFCGATGAGKTTALNVFSRYIPESERIVTIEDTPELRLIQEHWVPLVTKPANIEGKGEISIRELFVNSLRMRPDRVIIGEIRGSEVLDLVQSISSGHSGSLAIVHAETPNDCFNRMVTMMLMTGIRLSTREIQRQVATAIDLIVHVELYMDGKRRVAYVSEPVYDEQMGKFSIRHIFKYVEKGVSEKGQILGDWEKDSTAPTFMYKFAKKRVVLPNGFFNEA